MTTGAGGTVPRCAACGAAAPAALFCGTCGAEQNTGVTALRRLLRPRFFVAAHRQPITLPLITSTLCPHLSSADRTPFRHGLFLALAALVTASLLGLLPILVVLTSFGVTLLFVLYLWRSDIFRDIPARAMVVASLVGVALSVSWWVWTGSLIAEDYGIPLSAGFQLMNVVNIGMAVSAGDALLMLLPAVVVRLLRPPSTESLDGFVIGALGALSYTTAASVTWLGTQFTAGLLDSYDPGRLLARAVLYGIFDPLTAAASGGMAGLLLWFRPSRRHSQPRRVRSALACCAALGPCYYVAAYAIDAGNNARWLEGLIEFLVTVLALLTLRFAMQIAVLHEQPDPVTGIQARCIHCDEIVPDMPFCPRCGTAARASSRSARRLRGAVDTRHLD